MTHIEEFAKEKVEDLFGREYDASIHDMRVISDAIKCGYTHATYQAYEYLSKLTKMVGCSEGGSEEVPMFTKEELEAFKHIMMEK